MEPAVEQEAEKVAPTSTTDSTKAPAAPPVPDDELVDYEDSPEHSNIEINVMHLSKE